MPSRSRHPTRLARARAVSLREAARLLAKNRGTLSRWLAEGCPAIESAARADGLAWQLDLAAVLDWHAERAVAAERERLEAKHHRDSERLRLALEAAEGDSSGPITRSEALRRKAVAEARLAEIAVMEREDELVPHESVTRTWVTMATTIRARIGAIPHRFAPELALLDDPAEVFVVLDRAVREALEALADAGPEHLISTGTIEELVAMAVALEPRS